MELTRIIWDSEDKLTKEQIEDTIEQYLNSNSYQLLKRYDSYYSGVNYELKRRVKDRQWRGKTPNNYVPTAYYSTVVDSMAGYLFSNVQYQGEEETDQDYSETFNEILTNNNVDVKDMQTGINALCFNKGIELVYTEGDEQQTDIKFSTFSPLEWIILWNSKVDSEVFCGIRLVVSSNDDFDYMVDVIYADEWQYYYIKNGELSPREVDGEVFRELLFNECPVIVYNSSIINNQSPFHVIIPYIDALDYIMTGNANEIERLVDAILVLGKKVAPEDLLRMDEWKILDDMKTEDRAEYITKDASPEFRKYVSELLINEIHKHSHVIDWYSPDSGLSGQVSAKALRTRLFDMDMYSQRIEKKYREGADKRKRLIDFLINLKGLSNIGNLTTTFNRTVPDDKEDKMESMKGVDWLSNQTKVEILGLDWDVEKKRLAEQRAVGEIEVAFDEADKEEISEEAVEE